MGNDKIEKLKGRENYDVWKFAAKSYLVIKGFWPSVLGEETDSNKVLQAISTIGLLVEPTNYSYVQNCSTAKEAWDALEKAFEDSGVLRRMDLLKYFARLELGDCDSMEDYVNKMCAAHQKLVKSGTSIPEDVAAQLMLSGLPEEYRPMVMAICNNGKDLTIDLVRTNLLQEIRHEASGSDSAIALMSKKNKKKQTAKSKNNAITCFECDKKGHYANKCPSKKKESTNKLLFAATSLVAKADCATNWVIDSGASAHITMDENYISETCEPSSKEIVVGNNGRLEVKCAGDVQMAIAPNNKSEAEQVTLKNVLCVPEICANLMSVSQMAKRGKTLVFDSQSCRIFDENAELMATAPLVNDLYSLNSATDRTATAFAVTTDANLWHRRMGHACRINLGKIKSAVTGVNLKNCEIEQCVVCAQGKQTRASFKERGSRATAILELIHTDVCGPVSTNSFGGAKYLLTFVDDFSRKVFVFPMRKKSEVFELFLNFKNMVENQQNSKIKTLRSDNGTEFCNKQFDIFTAKHGIVHQRTAPYTPEQNGVAERMNRTLFEKIRCMLIDAELPKIFWAEAAATAAFLVNRTPCRSMENTTPEEIWTRAKPDLTALRVFGCKAMVHIPKENRSKLDPKSAECVFVGYSDTSKAYKLYNTKSRKLIVSRDVTFFETRSNQVIEKQKVTNRSALSPKIRNAKKNRTIGSVNDDSSDESSDDDSLSLGASEGDEFSEGESDPDENPNVTVTELDKTQCEVIPATATLSASSDQIPAASGSNAADVSTIETVDSNVLNESSAEFSEGSGSLENSVYDSFIDDDFEVAASEAACVRIPEDEDNRNASVRANHVGLLAAITDMSEPTTVREALNSPDGEKWKQAMIDEYNALIENETWELTELPAGRKAIDTKWVYKLKRDGDGAVQRHKARLVVKGYSQVKGIDYDETYSPVARYSSIRFLLAMAVKFDLAIHQMDAVTAFLQGELNEEIYMNQPVCFSDKSEKVCHLKKSLYGLKQSSRVWNNKLNSVLTQKLGYNRSSVDQCIYFRNSEQNTIVLAVYVDDILIFGSNSTMITKLKKGLSQHFKMKDIGAVSSVLGMHIVRNTDGSISIDQKQYLKDVLHRFNMTDSNPVNTPMDPNQRLSKDMCPTSDEERAEMASIPYQEAIGCIMYAAQISRPDIGFAVSTLSRYNTNYGKAHWSAVKRVLRYLKGTIDMKLTYRKDSEGEMVGYCDADWAGDQDERRSTTGYAFQLQGGAVSWATRKQPTIALSSTEAEFMSMVAAIQEALWLKRFECEIFISAPKSIQLYCDNQGAIQLATNSTYHARTKHIDVKNYFIREKLAEGVIKLNYRSTKEMIADIMTKPVNHAKLTQFIGQFGLNN